MTLQSATPRKTREEVEALMQGWRNDPCFDLEDTEGFEEYHDELLAYSNHVKAQWKQKRDACIAELSKPRSPGEIRYELSGGDTSYVLVEIAAQLAEANGLKRLEVEAINNLGGAVNLLTHEGSPLGKLAGSAESIAVNLDILVNRGHL